MSEHVAPFPHHHYVVCIGVLNELVLVYERTKPPGGSQGLNGPGGSVEPGETPAVAAAREWKQEVRGLPAKAPFHWTEIDRAEIRGEPITVHFMAAKIETPPGPCLMVDGHPATFVSPWDLQLDGRWADFFQKHARQAVRSFRA